MKKFSVNRVINSITETIGNGPHHLHEPVLGKREIEYLKGSPLKNIVAPPRRFRKLGTAVLGLAMVGLAMQYQNGLPSDDDNSDDDTSNDDNTGASQ